MKRIFLIAGIAALFAACNNSGTADSNMSDSVDTTMPMATTATTIYTPAEGDVIYKNGHLMVYKGTDWADADGNITLDNGIVVYKNGDVKKDDNTIRLDDGEVVTHSGNFFDKTGHAIKDAWNSTKGAVGKAGEAVGNGVSDAGKAVGNAVGDAGKTVGKAAGDAGKAVGNAASDVCIFKQKTAYEIKEAVTGDKH